ncbi:hypothetical protein R1flu_010583 [Riccia fluitans]|uniref:Uncharacterized protein n=1 Tax=Riccia fluitans TaxID=41844 RepID=A0ABD1Z5D7_9MARC
MENQGSGSAAGPSIGRDGPTRPTTAGEHTPKVVPPMDAVGILQALATLIREQSIGEMRSTKALQSVVHRDGRFDGRKVSHYLWEYRGEMILARVFDIETTGSFELVFELEIRDRVCEIARRYLTVPGGWDASDHAMREEFLEEDFERITRRIFLDQD